MFGLMFKVGVAEPLLFPQDFVGRAIRGRMDIVFASSEWKDRGGND